MCVGVCGRGEGNRKTGIDNPNRETAGNEAQGILRWKLFWLFRVVVSPVVVVVVCYHTVFALFKPVFVNHACHVTVYLWCGVGMCVPVCILCRS